MIDSRIKFHHIGIVVNSIKLYIEQSIYFQQYENVVYDPLQDSNLMLIKTDKDIFLELIEPKSKEATTYSMLQRSGKSSIFHHICYEVPSKGYVEKLCNDRGIKIFWGPHPAILFAGREVMFGYNRNQEIVEFLLY